MPRGKATRTGGTKSRRAQRKAVDPEPRPESYETPAGDTSASGPTGSALPLPPVTGATLDDAALLLLQLDPEERPGLQRLAEILDAIGSDSTVAPGIRHLTADARQAVASHLAGETPDFDRVHRQISELLEAASNLAAMPAAAKAAGPAPPAAVSEPPASAAIEPVPEEAGGTAPPVPAKSESSAAQPPKPARPETTVVPETDAGPKNLPPDSDADLIGEFVVESRELLEKAEAALLILESSPDDSEAVNVIFRGFHTIKGTSAFLGLTSVSELAHCAETLLSRVRDSEIKCAGGYADLALRSLDMLKILIDGVHAALAGKPMTCPQGYGRLKQLLTAPEAAGISDRPQESAAALAEAAPSQAGTVPAGELPGPAVREEEPATMAAPAAEAARPAADQRRNGRSDAAADTSVRVSTGRLDRLIEMVGELVIAQSMVAQDGTIAHGGHLELLRKVSHMGKIVRELQDLSMSMRMVPLRATFQKMNRLVRDLSHKSGKRVNLVAEDNDTEIDRNMVDIINDILVHMVRNSVDHGIEPPEARQDAGKEPVGTLSLSASHSGGNVVVEIRDDGRGLDRGKICEKAVARGLVDPDRTLSDSEIYNLIFAPGFSTADKVTDVSGRGVGMDVVRKGVEALHGRIDITNDPGKGCTFAVRLPLTLAITDGMLVRVGPERYIIPTATIYLSFRPEPGHISTVAGRGEMVMLRGELMPVFRLHRLFAVDGAATAITEGLLVVIGDGDRRCTLLVDELLGQHQFVAKSLCEGLGKVQGVAGAAILGDGHVGLILDPAEILVMARRSSGAEL
jgi:two-component system, chemotaxis family, sensor kinase CheA